MDETLIEFVSVNKAFGSHVVLKDMSLKIPRGKITCIIGRSGIGKSVTLKHIVGLTKADSGEVRFDGRDIGSMGETELYAVRRRMGILFQDAALFDSMTVGQNVAFPLVEHTDLDGVEIRKIVSEKIKIVGLRDVEKQMPSELSGGMRKRVGLARALALEPEVVLFDEPTSGLDPIMTDAIDQLILKTQGALGITAVVITHDLASLRKIADFIAMLHDGAIIASGSPEAVEADPNPIIQQFFRGESDGPVRVT